ncbi:hypothetical protein [Pontibacillus yanchengensis]|uniref:Uncharacterized protein n=1 Tax=Pontibacillus yanchengensis Y32 TaxID=1385514 RepID=A0A0A2TXS0_9BACI|nr:hypothetical protein [Pontibacillus yanchengensis]KGP74070.1 hypothetical protein N782_17175 [Pontibacillus yanchengensis Y32]
MKIQFQNFSIDQLSESSAVFSGDNFQTNFSTSTRRNEGNGSINGDKNIHINNKHIIMKNTDQQDDS